MIRLLPLALLAGCCQRPWQKFEMADPPDAECRVGESTHGYDLYLWECVEGEHVVLGFYSAEMSCADAEKQSAACGELTEWETTYADQLGAACEAPPEGMRWPE